ncbi:MAG TPA: DUF1345 domain-containing protein [Acetobacteraceae bacterium]|jgi:uncharacterized membrane protein
MIVQPVRWTWRVIRSRPRLFAGLACGLVARLLLPGDLNPITAAVVAWDAGVLAYLGLAAALFFSESVDRMPRNAEAQQEGEWTIFCLTIAVVVFSFAAIVSEFANAGNLPAARKGLHIVLVAVTLLLSWLMTHTTFAFRYAHEYYARDRGGPKVDGGLEFPGEQRPDYLDFMYFSLVLGMTFQVSDVQITSRKLRRVATVHGLLSFLFNTIILALTVNIAAGLV